MKWAWFALPLMALLVVAAVPFNDGFYEFWVNFDPQTAEEQLDWVTTTRIFGQTSGVLAGQFLSFAAGFWLAGRGRRRIALAVAASLGVALAVVTAAVALPLAGEPIDTVVVRLLLGELGAYPLLATAGVGLGARTRKPAVFVLISLLWWIAVGIGLLQNERLVLPVVVLLVPPIAAAASVPLTALASDGSGPLAGYLLLGSAAGWALLLNLTRIRRTRSG